MKRWLIIGGIVVILFVGGYFFLSLYAVKFIQAQIQKVVGPGLTIAEIKVKLTHLSIIGIQFEDPHSKKRFLKIEEMKIYPDLSGVLKRKIRIRQWKILKPYFFFYRTKEGVLVGPWVAVKKGEKVKEASERREGKGEEAVQVKIDQIQIRKGSIDFEDLKTDGSPGQIRLRELDLDIRNIQYPIISTHSLIELKGKMKGKMKGKTKEGEVYAKGWIDLKNMDLETSLKIREIELKIFEPYYRKKVSAEIESGYMDMDAKIAVKRRMIDAPGQLELVDLRIKEGGTVFWIPAKALVSLLKDKRNRIKVKFHVKGNMDDPQFKLQETFLTRIAISMAESLGLPIKVVGEKILEGSGKGAEGLMEGLKSIEELFKKKKEKKEKK
jgi:hypothetical protein